MLNGDIYGMIAPYATANLWVNMFSLSKAMAKFILVARVELVHATNSPRYSYVLTHFRFS